MDNPLHWNDPRMSWTLESARDHDEERKHVGDDRREHPRRSALGDRRQNARRALRSLLRL